MERRSARTPDRSFAGGPHALARRSVDLPALRELPFILFESGFALSRIILDACHRRGFELNVARSSQIDFIVALFRHKHGAAFRPRMIAEQRKHPSVARVPLAEADMDWHIAIIWRRGAYLSHAVKAWLDLVPTTRGKKQCRQPSGSGTALFRLRLNRSQIIHFYHGAWRHRCPDEASHRMPRTGDKP